LGLGDPFPGFDALADRFARGDGGLELVASQAGQDRYVHVTRRRPARHVSDSRVPDPASGREPRHRAPLTGRGRWRESQIRRPGTPAAV